ncbi:class I SAM-dependent methyltransferase [Lutibaculum baratangense]|uniref:Methyltransferase domain-containing protein n=1 Tax=Lutibaculum baratangense AMV1 TaxID=631454 RepID=V4RPX5_9HYPH|nr:SAM-dependent methyltransferase [Lutibaculum baratangense]ESR25240.1 hypothetical protein N177_1912 [Lutibaculum baratangense AMV1]
MAQATNKELLRFYQARISQYGFGYEAMWGDTARWKSQERFRPLTLLPIEARDVIVDIGCGTGDLAPFMKAAGKDITYIGVEAVPQFASRAREVTGCEVVELDAFRHIEALPAADWYVTFGTLNKSWSVADLDGEDDPARIHGLLERLFAKARKGIAASFVTDVVEYRKPDVANIDPAATAACLKRMTPHFVIYHGYSFYEFFAGAWRGQRR